MTPLNRHEAVLLLEAGEQMTHVGRQWLIGERHVHGNAARVILADGIQSGRLKCVRHKTWALSEVDTETPCQQIARHIRNNNIPTALQMLVALDGYITHIEQHLRGNKGETP